MTEQLNYIGQAINLVRRATGTRTSPGETCEHIRFTNPDRELKDGRLKLFGFEPSWHRGYKHCFIVNSIEHEISTSPIDRKLKNKNFLVFITLWYSIYHAYKCCNANNSWHNTWHSNIYKQDKLNAHSSWAWTQFYNIRARFSFQ